MTINGTKVKKYRGMGSLDAMTKGSEARYHSDTQSLKIAQGVAGTVVDKGSVLRSVPYLLQAVKQGFQASVKGCCQGCFMRQIFSKVSLQFMDDCRTWEQRRSRPPTPHCGQATCGWSVGRALRRRRAMCTTCFHTRRRSGEPCSCVQRLQNQSPGIDFVNSLVNQGSHDCIGLQRCWSSRTKVARKHACIVAGRSALSLRGKSRVRQLRKMEPACSAGGPGGHPSVCMYPSWRPQFTAPDSFRSRLSSPLFCSSSVCLQPPMCLPAGVTSGVKRSADFEADR